MIISHKHKFVFIHTTKVAGCSIVDALLGYHVGTSGKHWPDVDQKDALRFITHGSYGITSPYHNCLDLQGHAVARAAKDYFKVKGWDWDKYYKFGFMRNPWDRAVSMYSYGLRLIDEGSQSKWLHAYKKGFKHFLITAYDCDPYSTDSFQSQARYFSDYSGIIVDHIGKYENLQDDFNLSCRSIGIPMQNLPHVNKSKHKHYTEYYDDETIALVAKNHAEDIELGGYTYDS